MMEYGEQVKFWHYGKMFEGRVFNVVMHGDVPMVSFHGESLRIPHPAKWTLHEWTEQTLE
jgi:hypothetical protein